MNRTLKHRNLIAVLLPLTLMMFSCTQSSSQKDAGDVIENLNLLTIGLIEIKEELLSDEIYEVLTEFDAGTNYGFATLPEGIPNPGAPTLITHESVHTGYGGIETLSFPEEDRELATRLYGILQAHGVQDNIAFIDFRDVPIEELPTGALPHRGLERLNFDTRTQLCAYSSGDGCYCRCTSWDEDGNEVCNWEPST